MDTITLAIVLLTQFIPSERQIDTIYISDILDKPRIFSRKTFSKQNNRSIYFDQILTDTAVHYVDHRRKLRAIQPMAKVPIDLGLKSKSLYQFNDSDYLKLDSVQLKVIDKSKSEWCLYSNTFYHTDHIFGDSNHIFNYETDVLCFKNASLSTISDLAAIKDIQFVVDKSNQPLATESGYLIGLVVAARHTGYRLDPLSDILKKSIFVRYSSLQSVEQIDGPPPANKVTAEDIDTSYQLVPFASFFD